MKILITGPTGFIGRRLTSQLIAEGHELFLLVRKASLANAQEIFKGYTDINYVLGDISNNDVVDGVSGTTVLSRDIEAVIHLAAHYDLNSSMTDAYVNNVIGTQNLLYLMQKMKNLRYFHHISTYAVSGAFDGEFQEEELDSQVGFPDNYSKSKMQAEFLVRNAKLPGVKIRIYRPGIIVGDSKTGDMDKIDGPYYFFRFFSQLSRWTKYIPLKVLPVSFHSDSTLPFLPVDVLVDWLKIMVTSPTSHDFRSYHLLPDEKIFIPEFLEESLKEFDLDLRIQRIPFPELYAKVLPYLNIPAPAVAYMQSKTKYSVRNLKSDFPQLKAPKLKKYLSILIKKSQEKVL